MVPDVVSYLGRIAASNDPRRAGTHANRPAANTVSSGWQYFETDTFAVFQSDGTTWTQVGTGIIDASEVPSLEQTAHKGAANGYAGLGAGSLVPMANLASGTPDGTKFIRDDGTLAVPPGTGSGITTLILFDSTLGADAANIDTGANGIAATAHTLLVSMTIRTTDAVVQSQVNITLNGDTGANYDRSFMQMFAGAVSGGSANAQTFVPTAVLAANAVASNFSPIEMQIPAYRQTTAQKVGQMKSAGADPTSGGSFFQFWGWRWRSTAAVNRLTVAANSGNIKAGSRLTIYGLL